MYDVIIIGGGPAGMTAAIYVARAGQTVKLLDKTCDGGQIVNSSLIENFPGAPAVSGITLANAMISQVLSAGAEFDMATVLSVRSLPNYNLMVEAEDAFGDRLSLETRSVIIATGSKHRHLNVPGEDFYLNKGVHYCAVCDGPLYSGKRVLVAGSGNSGAQYALELAEYCNEVTICDLTPTFCCEKTLEDRIKANPKIHTLFNRKIKEIVGDGTAITTVTFSDGFMAAVDGIFIAVGQDPATEPFRGRIDMDARGYLIADNGFRSSMCGVFVAGDCRRDTVRQAVVAAGEGASAAVQALRYLRERKE